jgi:tetratricopeptide (TPR) repeat protein
MKAGQENLENGFTLARILTEAHPFDPETHELYGDLLLLDKKYQEGREQYRQALQLGRDKYRLWQQLIFCDAELRQYEVMAKDCDKAIELFPNMPELYLYSCIAHLQQKHYGKVISSAREGLDLGLADVELQIQLLANMGDAANFAKDYTLSDSSYSRALYLNGSNSYVLNNYAYFLSLRKVKLDKAEQMSKKTLDKDPENPTYLDTYGWILYQQGRYEDARPFLQKAIEKDQSAEVSEHYGDLLYRLGKVAEAVTYWKKAKEQSPDSSKLEQKIRERKIIE